MSNRPRRMQSFGIVLLLSAFLLWPSSSFGQQVCFDEAVASQMVVRLEQAKIAEEQLTNQAGINTELQGQLAILRDTIKLYEDQISTYKNLRAMDQSMSDAKDKACAAEVKAAKPSFMQDLGKYSTGGIIGAVLAAVAMLLL